MARVAPVLLLLLAGCSTRKKESPGQILSYLPGQIGPFAAGEGVKTFSDKRLGAALAFNAPGGTALTVYVYDMGNECVPDGCRSPLAVASAAEAVLVIRTHETQGHYRRVRIVSEGIKKIGSGDAMVHEVARVALEYVVVGSAGAGDSHVRSYLYVSGVRNHILKVRVTAPDRAAIGGNQLDRVVASILDAL